MRTLRLATATLLALALAGCTAAPTTSAPASPSTPAAAPTSPAPEPEPPIAELVIDGSGFALVDATGEVDFTHRWADEVGPAVAALEAAIGVAPGKGFEAHSGGHIADFDRYEWDGLTLGDAVGLEKPRTEYFLPSWLEASTPSIAGIAVHSTSGVTVGSSVASVVAIEPHMREDTGTAVVYKIDAVEPTLIDSEDQATDMVLAAADAADTTIERLRAPTPSRTFF